MAFTYSGKMVDLGFGRGWLDTGPAASIKRIDKAIGHPLQITEAGRDYATQNAHYQTYLRNGWPIALAPWTPSIHQKGAAVDSNEAQRIVALLEEHGWRRTVYRWVNGVWKLVEEWHFEYFPHLDLHINDPASSIQEDEDMTIAVRLNGKHLFHMKFGGIKHLSDNRPVKGPQNTDPATLTMKIAQPDDKWIEMNTDEFNGQLDAFHIPRSVVDLKTGFVWDVDRVDEKNPGGQRVSGGAWEWARAAYANTLVAKPVKRY